MSDGSEFHRSDSATGKERRPMVLAGMAAQPSLIHMYHRGHRKNLSAQDTNHLSRKLSLEDKLTTLATLFACNCKL